MTFKEKNIAVTLINFSLILTFYVYRIWHMLTTDTFTPENMFNLFGWVVFFAVIVTVVAIILTHVVPGVLRNRRTGKKDPVMNDFEDERDKLIDLRGTRITYTLSSLGSGVAMLTFVNGQPPLVMFSMMIFFGVLAQIVGDVTRLLLYRRGF